MKGTRKLICVLMTLCLLLSLGGFALAGSGEPSGETLSRYEELTEVKSYPNGLTIADNAGYTGAEGYFIVMTVDGQYTPQAPGRYTGEVVFTPVKMTESNDGTSDYSTKSLIVRTADGAYAADAAVNGSFDEKGLADADIVVDDPNMSVVTVNGGTYRIDDSDFEILQTGNHESGGNDFTGDGCAIAATGDSVLYINNVNVTGDGVTRTCLYGGLSTHDSYPTIYVTDSVFTSLGDPEGEDCSVWVLGLHGVVRTCQFCDYYDVYYANTRIDSFGWACLSVDGTEAPTAEDLRELSAAYVEGKGYADASGEIMGLNEFAVAATGLTDDYLAQLAAVETEEDLTALPQTQRLQPLLLLRQEHPVQLRAEHSRYG